MRRFLHILLFLTMVDEGAPTILYRDYMFAPFVWAHTLFVPIAKIRPFDILILIALIWSRLNKSTKAPPVAPMRRALLVAASATFMALMYGLARGGDGRAAGWQVYLLFSTILASFTFASVFHTAEHFIGVIKTLVAAGLYHAVMGILFYVFYVKRGAVMPFPGYLTCHDDTVLWTVSVGFLLLNILQKTSTKTRALSMLGILVLLVAIQYNHRRLAWISLLGSIITLYFLIPPSAMKQRIRRAAMIIVPVLALYAAIGMGRPEGIFRPLQAFQTVSTAEDSSTKARMAENLGLIATANQGWILGTGFGHKYVEVSSKYQIYFFELWPYVPHNSVLGFLAYTGYLGFIGYWLTFPTAAFLHARTARLGARPVDRFVGMIGVIQIVACANQWYGDMGCFSAITDYTLATCFAAALRVPIGAGVWEWNKKRMKSVTAEA